jgi:hypothetical protein
MPYTRNRIAPERKSLQKKRNRAEPLQNVISLRISDDEKKALGTLARSSSKGISEIMREAIDLWISKRRRLCMD